MNSKHQLKLVRVTVIVYTHIRVSIFTRNVDALCIGSSYVVYIAYGFH